MKRKIWMTAAVAFLLALILTAVCAKKQESIQELLDLGQRYLLEENYEQAIITFEKAIAVDAKSVDAYTGLADAYIGNKNTDKAIEILEKGYELTQDESLKEKAESVRKVDGSARGFPGGNVGPEDRDREERDSQADAQTDTGDTAGKPSEALTEASGDYDSSGGYGIKWVAGMPLSGLSCATGFQEGYLGLEGSHGDIGEVATLIAGWWPASDGLSHVNVEEDASYYLPLWKEEMPEFFPDAGGLFSSDFPVDEEMGQEIYMLLLSIDRNYQMKAYSIIKIDLR